MQFLPSSLDSNVNIGTTSALTSLAKVCETLGLANDSEKTVFMLFYPQNLTRSSNCFGVGSPSANKFSTDFCVNPKSLHKYPKAA